jgi:hypothetical protein
LLTHCSLLVSLSLSLSPVCFVVVVVVVGVVVVVVFFCIVYASNTTFSPILLYVHTP